MNVETKLSGNRLIVEFKDLSKFIEEHLEQYKASKDEITKLLNEEIDKAFRETAPKWLEDIMNEFEKKKNQLPVVPKAERDIIRDEVTDGNERSGTTRYRLVKNDGSVFTGMKDEKPQYSFDGRDAKTYVSRYLAKQEKKQFNLDDCDIDEIWEANPEAQ